MSALPVTGGKLIGFPYQGSHRPGATTPANWQSDNAVDIAVPVGTPVYAVHDGVIGPNIGSFNSTSPYLQGQRLSVLWGGNGAYYAHLSKIVVKAGQQVKAGDLVGYSGSANGVAHLHFAVEKGTPLDWVKGLASKASDAAKSLTSAGNSVSQAGCASSVLIFVACIGGITELVKILL